MAHLTRPEIDSLRHALEEGQSLERDAVLALLHQSEYALDCASLLEEACAYPAEPYSETAAFVAGLRDRWNALWNHHHYR